MKENKFPCVEFDDEKNELTILIGSPDTIRYEDIAKASVLNEDAGFRGKSQPFSHQVLGGTTFLSGPFEPQFYVGIKLVLKDGSIHPIYISDRKTGMNSDIYHEDTKLAEKIKKKIDKRIQ